MANSVGKYQGKTDYVRNQSAAMVLPICAGPKPLMAQKGENTALVRGVRRRIALVQFRTAVVVIWVVWPAACSGRTSRNNALQTCVSLFPLMLHVIASPRLAVGISR
jgi:hypothetical protein